MPPFALLSWAVFARGWTRRMRRGAMASPLRPSRGSCTRRSGLHSAWKLARAAAAQRRARGAWQKLLRKYPGVGVKMLRAMDAASYAWLYRNDRAWLTEHTPARATSQTNPRQGTVRLDERDLSLSGEVERAVERLARPGRPLQLWQIYQAVPGLKPKLAVLHRLPLTEQVIERALGPRRCS